MCVHTCRYTMNEIVAKLVHIKCQQENCGFTELEVFGFKLSVLECVGKIFQLQDMLNESERYWDATNGLSAQFYIKS